MNPAESDPLRAFSDYQRRRNLSRRTVDGRHRTLTLFVAQMAPASIVDASREDIEAWLDGCAVGARSRATYLSTVRAFYDWLVDTDQREDNPARRIPLPRTQRLVPRPIADDDLWVALRGADDRMRAWLMLAAYAGLRAKEIALLRRQDLLLEREPPLLIVNNGKGGRQRIVPVNPVLESALHVYGLPASGFLFTTNDGRPMKPETVSSYVGRYLHALGISASCHQGRHWFATTVYQQTRDLRLVQELLGHADPSTTAIYTAFAPGAGAEAVQALNVAEGRPVESQLSTAVET